MEFSLPIFLIALGLGVLQLAVGLVLGRCLPLRAAPTPPPDNAARLQELAERLHQLVTRVARDVGEHETQIEKASAELAAAHQANPGNLPELVLSTVSQILLSNEHLQTRLSAAEERLQQQAEQIAAHVVEARTDPLTRLPNRRAFDDELVRRIAEWQRRGAACWLMMIDVDHFKQLNDRHGHLAGDHALRRIAETLRTALRDAGAVARVGGEEFAVLSADHDLGLARKIAERLRTAVADLEFRFEKARWQLTVSLGLARIQSGDDPVALVRRADEALYAAKRNGRNCTYYHNGQTCQRIGSADRHDAELEDVCDSLRQRVAQVAERE